MEQNRFNGHQSPSRFEFERLRIVEYHFGPAAHLDEDTRKAALDTLARGLDMSSKSALSALAEVLSLRVKWRRRRSDMQHVLTLTGCTPTLDFAGFTTEEAEKDALVFVRRALEHEPVPLRPKSIRSL